MTTDTTETQAFSIFCDDIREEINSKTTIVGMYGGEMLVAAQGPVVIPQLCYICKVILDPKRLPKTISIILRQYNFNGEMSQIGQIEFPPVSEIPFPPQPTFYGPGEPRFQIQAALRMSPLPVSADSTIRSFMVIDQVEKAIGSISIRIVDTLP